MSKLIIWFDFDNTLLNSTKEIVRQFNNKHNTNHDWTKTRKWNFTDVCEGITNDEVNEMFGSKEFFNNVEFTELYRVYLRLADMRWFNKETDEDVDIDFGIISKGNPSNLYYKEAFINCKIPHDRLILESDNTMDKSIICGDFLLVDDNQDCVLTSNCKHNVIYSAFGKCEWNEKVYDMSSDDSWIDIVGNGKELYNYIIYALRKQNIIRY